MIETKLRMLRTIKFLHCKVFVVLLLFCPLFSYKVKGEWFLFGLFFSIVERDLAKCSLTEGTDILVVVSNDILVKHSNNK